MSSDPFVRAAQFMALAILGGAVVAAIQVEYANLRHEHPWIRDRAIENLQTGGILLMILVSVWTGMR